MPEEKYDKMYLLNTYPSCVCGTASTLGTHTLAFKQLTAFALQSHARRGTGAEPRVPVPDAGARGDPSSGLGIGAKPGHLPLLVPHTALQQCPWQPVVYPHGITHPCPQDKAIPAAGTQTQRAACPHLRFTNKIFQAVMQ